MTAVRACPLTPELQRFALLYKDPKVCEIDTVDPRCPIKHSLKSMS